MAVLEQRARAAGWERDAARHALRAAAHLGPDEARRIATAAREAHPDDVQLQQMVQDTVDGVAR